MSLFWAKKFVAFWLTPLSVCITGFLVGLWLLRSPKRAALGRALLAGSLVLLMLCSNKFVSKALIRPLETRYPAIPEFTVGTALPPQLASCRFVVVLGGAHGESPGTPATSLLSSSALARITEGARLMRALPEARLIVSGPRSTPRRQTHAAVLARAAESLGIAADRIFQVDDAHDTEDEAHATRRIVGDHAVALVTSSWHMPRSVALFRAASVTALPCPTDYQAHAHDSFSFDDLLWESSALNRTTTALRERLGYLWIWLRGKG